MLLSSSSAFENNVVRRGLLLLCILRFSSCARHAILGIQQYYDEPTTYTKRMKNMLEVRIIMTATLLWVCRRSDAVMREISITCFYECNELTAHHPFSRGHSLSFGGCLLLCHTRIKQNPNMYMKQRTFGLFNRVFHFEWFGYCLVSACHLRVRKSAFHIGDIHYTFAACKMYEAEIKSHAQDNIE